jgi:tetratricopeptide (TPR) repeat protein
VGSKLVVVAEVIVAVALARVAAAEPADDLTKQAAEAYSAGKYDDAIALFERAYAIDHKNETLYALAQAERLGGHCPAAIKHYKKLLALLTDLDSARMIESNVALCEHTEAIGKPAAPPTPELKATPTPAATVRVERRSDPFAVSLVATGALALGVGTGLWIASDQARADAKTAGTLDSHNTLDKRADVERGGAYAALGVGVALVGYAIYRWARKRESPAVAVAPAGRSVTLEWHW